MSFAKGGQGSVCDLKSRHADPETFILAEVTLHLTYWATVIADTTLCSHWSWSGHRAKHLPESSRWVHYYCNKKHHFPHSETESGRGSYLAQSNAASISDALNTDLCLILTPPVEIKYTHFFSPSKLDNFSGEALSFHIWTFSTYSRAWDNVRQTVLKQTDSKTN